MMMRHEAMLKVAMHLQNMLEVNYGVESLIVGGFPRDIGMGKPELVNDVDMVIHRDESLIAIAEDVLEDIAKLFSLRPWISEVGYELFLEYGDDFASEQTGSFIDENPDTEMDSDFKERIVLVMRLMIVTTGELGDHDFNIDILMSTMDKSEELYSFLDTFDFSINRWVIGPLGNIPVFSAGNGEYDYKKVTRIPGFTCRSRMAYRIGHLRKKYPELDWSNCTKTFDEFSKGGAA